MTEEENVLFLRQDKVVNNVSCESEDEDAEENNDVWDDTLLIRAYDKAVKAAKEKVMKSLEAGATKNDETNVDSSSAVEEGNSLKRKKEQETKKKVWKVGSSCRAVYSSDGEEYEAAIVKLLRNGKSCIVRYYGYDNEEKVSLDDLRPSLGKEEIELQIRCAKEERGNWSVGDVCRAVYSGDGIEYEAEIVKIFHAENLCLIRFLGYGNQEEVFLDDLVPSLGPKEIELQIFKVHTEYGLFQNGPTNNVPKSYTRSSARGLQNGHAPTPLMMPPPPPRTWNQVHRGASQAMPQVNMESIQMPMLAPPTVDMMLHAPHNKTEALTAMLMSWYMNGYHTGYYQGFMHAQESRDVDSAGKKTFTPMKNRNSSPKYH